LYSSAIANDGGPPLRLMIKPEAISKAHHTPIPVPLHWQDEIKAGLDEDACLGVIEPVEIGKPVTWCHQMVICTKRETTSHEERSISKP